MNNKEKWNYIVDIYNEQKYLKEDIIQETWGNIFYEIFGYSKLQGEIEVHRNIQIGSTQRVITDIIITDGTNDLFIVELKQHTLDTGEEQLISYLRLMEINIGVLVNKKITIYYYQKPDNNLLKYEINLNEDLIDGEKFIELFSKPFNPKKVLDFILLKDERNKKILDIRKKVNNDYLLEILKTELLKSYEISEIEEALVDFKICVTNINDNMERKVKDKAIQVEPRKDIFDHNYLKGVRRVSAWARKPNQYNHRIIRAFLQLENELGEVRLHNLKLRCSNKEKYPDVFVPTFDNNFVQMKFDRDKSNGKIFEEKFGIVTIWEKARDEIELNREYFMFP